MDWEDLAACKGQPIDVFFPNAGGGEPYRQARSYCRRCPVRMACLEDALRAEHDLAPRSNMRHGMFGGATPDERAAMRWIFDVKVSQTNKRSGNVMGQRNAPRAAQTAEGRDRELVRSPR